MTRLRIPLIVVGAVLGLAGVLLMLGAVSLLGERPDADGFYMHDPYIFDQAPPAIITGDADILEGRVHQMRSEGVGGSWIIDDPEKVRIEGRHLGNEPLFLGIGPRPAIEAYLGGTAHFEITEMSFNGKDVYDLEGIDHSGEMPVPGPSKMDFWAVSVQGTGLQTLDWTVEPGDWTGVVITADGYGWVSLELAFGANVTDLNAIGWRFTAIAVPLLVGGGLLLFLGISARSRSHHVA